MQQTGKLILIAGLALVVIGAILWLFGPRLSFLGKLPGDIRIQKENFTMYIPITTMLLLSLLLSAIFWLIRKL